MVPPMERLMVRELAEQMVLRWVHNSVVDSARRWASLQASGWEYR